VIWSLLILGIILLIAGVFIARWYATTQPTTLLKCLRWGAIGLGGALAIFLAVTGKAHLALIPLAVFFLPRLINRLMAPGSGLGGGSPLRGRSSNVESRYLRMTLDHDSGAMIGEVIDGRYAGQALGDLSFQDLLDLHRECLQGDPQSAQLLETYLERNFGADWAAQTGHDGARTRASGQTASSGSAMSVDEAREILGVGPKARDEEIKEAHRGLMQKLHPDHGGSTYLAGKINRAKEVLLGS
jgi:hypothetical protein